MSRACWATINPKSIRLPRPFRDFFYSSLFFYFILFQSPNFRRITFYSQSSRSIFYVFALFDRTHYFRVLIDPAFDTCCVVNAASPVRYSAILRHVYLYSIYSIPFSSSITFWIKIMYHSPRHDAQQRSCNYVVAPSASNCKIKIDSIYSSIRDSWY